MARNHLPGFEEETPQMGEPAKSKKRQFSVVTLNNWIGVSERVGDGPSIGDKLTFSNVPQGFSRLHRADPISAACVVHTFLLPAVSFIRFGLEKCSCCKAMLPVIICAKKMGKRCIRKCADVFIAPPPRRIPNSPSVAELLDWVRRTDDPIAESVLKSVQDAIVFFELPYVTFGLHPLALTKPCFEVVHELIQHLRTFDIKTWFPFLIFASERSKSTRRMFETLPPELTGPLEQVRRCLASASIHLSEHDTPFPPEVQMINTKYCPIPYFIASFLRKYEGAWVVGTPTRTIKCIGQCLDATPEDIIAVHTSVRFSLVKWIWLLATARRVGFRVSAPQSSNTRVVRWMTLAFNTATGATFTAAGATLGNDGGEANISGTTSSDNHSHEVRLSPDIPGEAAMGDTV